MQVRDEIYVFRKKETMLVRTNKKLLLEAFNGVIGCRKNKQISLLVFSSWKDTASLDECGVAIRRAVEVSLIKRGSVSTSVTQTAAVI